MDLPTLKSEYAYELKESFFRRFIANVIDAFLISLVVFLVGGIIVAGIMNSNPMGIFFGLLGDVAMKTKQGDLKMTPLFVAMIGFTVVYLFISSLYFGITESGNRRTPGKAIMHLEIATYMKDPTFFNAILRNLTKIAGGALGGYFLGIIGANIGSAVAVYIDYASSPGSKVDIRQRVSEKSLGMMVLTENDENDIGAFAVDGAPTMEESLKGTFEKHKKPIKTPKPASSSGPSKGFAGFGKGSTKEKTEVIAEAPKERSSFGKAFGGFGSKDQSRDVEKSMEPSAPIPQPEAEKPVLPLTTSETIPDKNELRDRTVLSFMMEFDIDENRAQALYDTGYRRKEDLADAIPEDLVMLKGINPTIARRIISKAKEV